MLGSRRTKDFQAISGCMLLQNCGDVKTIGKHINNALREELSDENAVVAKFATTAADGKTYMTEHYNLNVHDRRVKSGRKRKENDGTVVARTHITGI